MDHVRPCAVILRGKVVKVEKCRKTKKLGKVEKRRKHPVRRGTRDCATPRPAGRRAAAAGRRAAAAGPARRRDGPADRAVGGHAGRDGRVCTETVSDLKQHSPAMTGSVTCSRPSSGPSTRTCTRTTCTGPRPRGPASD
jgi:hypothetical protein